MHPGTLFKIPLPDGQFGGAQLLGIDGTAAGVRLFGVLWRCAPGPLDFEDAPPALEIAVGLDSLDGLEVVGQTPVAAPWTAAGQPVVRAPLVVLLQALLAD